MCRTAPGIYIWKDAFGKILYIGKSKVLRDRMRSYFGAPRGLSSKTRRMVAQIADFEIILTSSELEALLLEMNMIKQHRPKYNILLKDDKSYPFIKVTLPGCLAAHFHHPQDLRGWRALLRPILQRGHGAAHPEGSEPAVRLPPAVRLQR